MAEKNDKTSRESIFVSTAGNVELPYVFDSGQFTILGSTGPFSTTPQSREIFVGYPYEFPADDYRRPFKDLQKAFDVKFVFADDRITSLHLLQKATRMIQSSRFSIFDITTWNPNVALELGVAIGLGKPYFLLFNPTNKQEDVPADLGGVDRIQYESYSELETGLTRLLVQSVGIPQREESKVDPMDVIHDKVTKYVEENDGPKIGDIAEGINVNMEFAKTIVRSMVEEGELESTGQTRATRYYLAGNAPPE